MKTNLFAVTATALMAMSQIGAAQTMSSNLKADVPVAFQVLGKAMSQGNYTVLISRASGGTPMITFRNADSKESGMLVAVSAEALGLGASGKASIKFICVEGYCGVDQITTRDTKYTFAPHRLSPEAKKKLYTVSVPLGSKPAAE